MAKIKADREERVAAIKKLKEEGRYIEMFKEIDAFYAAYPKAKEGRELKKIVYGLRKKKETRGVYEAKDLWDKVVDALGKNSNAQPKDLGKLLQRYPDSYWARLASYLWIENNTGGRSVLPEKKKR